MTVATGIKEHSDRNKPGHMLLPAVCVDISTWILKDVFRRTRKILLLKVRKMLDEENAEITLCPITVCKRIK